MRATDLSHQPVLQGLLEATGHANTDSVPSDAWPSESVAATAPPPVPERLHESPLDDVAEPSDLDELTDDRLWDANAVLEPLPEEPQNGAQVPFTPPIPPLHDVEPLPEGDDDRPTRRAGRQPPRRWRWLLAGGLALLVVVVVAVGGDDPPPPVTAPTALSEAPAHDPARTVTRSKVRRRAPATPEPSEAQHPRRRPATTTPPTSRTPTTPAPASAPAPARTTPTPTGPWSEEFFRP